MELVGEYLTKIDEMINRQICVIKQLTAASKSLWYLCALHNARNAVGGASLPNSSMILRHRQIACGQSRDREAALASAMARFRGPLISDEKSARAS